MYKIPPEQYPELMSLVNQTYTDRIESIEAARIEENGDFLIVARDGNKRLAIRMTDDDISIRLMK
jgi:hypothetical protein